MKGIDMLVIESRSIRQYITLIFLSDRRGGPSQSRLEIGDSWLHLVG